MKEGVIIDTRSPEAFAGSHIPGSYNVWLRGLPAFGGWIANENTSIFLVVDGAEKIDQAVRSLARIGIDGVQAMLTSGVETWREQGLPIESIATTSAAETARRMQRGRVHVLDVRDEYEWNEKHIPGAVHRYVGDLEEDPPDLPKDGEIVVHCSVGHRSGVAVSMLKRQGYIGLHNMLGGIAAWEKLGLPLEKPG